MLRRAVLRAEKAYLTQKCHVVCSIKKLLAYVPARCAITNQDRPEQVSVF
jgi:hypothetical protein